MIYEVSGDILHSQAQVIAHGIAPGDHFNQGLALAIRERWPALAKDFRHFCHQSSPKPGAIWSWAGPQVHIVNLFIQDPAPSPAALPGKAQIKYLRSCLEKLADLALAEKFRSLALPRIGTGVGKLEWEEVKGLLSEKLQGLPLPVFVYAKYIPGAKAEEPGA
ncbi:MAG: macro domain-containing protein [Deltaproteobacteria bacterium]|nr:macro domain-containing protein [Deltaproteobacteria bacterium]